MKLLFLGDSITDCSHSFDPENLGFGYVRMIAETLAADIDPRLSASVSADIGQHPSASDVSGRQLSAPVQISNKGIDGFTVSRVYDMWQQLPDSADFPGKSSFDAVSVLVGVNDVGVWMDCGHSPESIQNAVDEFAVTYEDLVCDILDWGVPKLILMEPFIFPSPACYQIWQPYLGALSEKIRDIARRFPVTFLPLQKLLLEAGRSQGYERVTLDGIHLTEEGNRLLANAWLNAF